MFVIIICLLIVVLMPLLAKLPVAIGMAKLGAYDNKHPRAQQAKLEGFSARAYAAHQNCFEAICLFAPSVLLVLALDEHNVYTVQLCIAFVVSRFLYIGFYWANWDKLRSIVWVLGLLTILAHYWMLLM